MFCFGCNLPVKRESDLPANYKSLPSNAPPAEGTPSTSTTNSSTTATPSTTTTAAAPSVTMDKDVPSVAKTSSAPKEVSILDKFSDDFEQDFEEEEEEEAEFDAEAFALARKKSDEVSARLGEYMLKGWTLMDIECNSDGCPLMRSPDRKTLKCLLCGMDYEETSEPEEDDIVKVHPPKPENKTAPTSATTASPSTSTPPPTTTATPATATLAAAAATPIAASPSLPQASFAPLPSRSQALAAEMTAVEAALTAKLGWVRGRLELSRDVAECRSLAETLGALLAAAGQLPR